MRTISARSQKSRRSPRRERAAELHRGEVQERRHRNTVGGLLDRTERRVRVSDEVDRSTVAEELHGGVRLSHRLGLVERPPNGLLHRLEVDVGPHAEEVEVREIR